MVVPHPPRSPSIETFGLFILATVRRCLFQVYLDALSRTRTWVRRRWPQTMISWSRLLTGQFRDPLVGRDILFGVMLGVDLDPHLSASQHSTHAHGRFTRLGAGRILLGGRQALGAWMMQVIGSILGTLQFFFVLFGLKVVLRKDWLAAIAFVGLLALPRGLTAITSALSYRLKFSFMRLPC